MIVKKKKKVQKEKITKEENVVLETAVVEEPAEAKEVKKDTYEENGVTYKVPRILENKEKSKKDKGSKRKDKEKNIVRYNPSHKSGLTSAEIESRIAEGLTNVVENKNTKTYTQIFLSNIFTFFNIIFFINFSYY